MPVPAHPWDLERQREVVVGLDRLVRARRAAADDRKSARVACSVGEVAENVEWRVRESLWKVDSRLSESSLSVRVGLVFRDVP